MLRYPTGGALSEAPPFDTGTHIQTPGLWLEMVPIYILNISLVLYTVLNQSMYLVYLYFMVKPIISYDRMTGNIHKQL